ncbi:MAG: hypothetical protein ABI240_08910 [Sphingomonas sp.]
MISTKVIDHMGKEHAVGAAEDINRLVTALELHRDQLAELMLGIDRGAAMAAERESDRIEDAFLPKFQAEIDRVRGLLDTDAADEHRHAKARAIKDRPRMTAS